MGLLGFFYVSDFRNVHEIINYLEVFRCAMRGFSLYLRHSQDRHPSPGLWEPGRSQGLDPAPAPGRASTCGPTRGFCLYHIKTSRGEGLSPPTDPAQADARACLNTHRMSVEQRQAWRSNRGTGSRRSDLLQMVRSSTATDPCMTLDELLPLSVPLFPTIFYLPLSYRL